MTKQPLSWPMAQAWASYAAWRLGPLGLAGLAMATAAVVLTVLSQLWWKPAVLQAEQATQALLSQPSRRATAAQPAATERQWLSQLPAAAALPEMLAGLHHQAGRSGLRIERAEYRPPVVDGPLRRVQVLLPVQGEYKNIKRWLGRVLQTHPYCALDELSFQRQDSATAGQAGELQARVMLSVYLREAR